MPEFLPLFTTFTPSFLCSGLREANLTFNFTCGLFCMHNKNFKSTLSDTSLVLSAAAYHSTRYLVPVVVVVTTLQ
jgi:hypothetical protein